MRLRHPIKIATVVATAALVSAACGGGANTTDSTSTSSGAGFTSCMVTDSGGADDKSFNETSWNGLKDAERDGLTDKPTLKQSDNEKDFKPNVTSLVQDDCGVIVTVGFLLAAATKEAAENNPDERFAIVDYKYSKAVDKVDEIDNVKPLVFNTNEAAFLAGYAAAAHAESVDSDDPVVGTWGGVKIPTVTIFMDGFVQGVEKYNDAHDAEVEAIGWDVDTQNGEFVGDFTSNKVARTISDQQIDEGAEVIFPVAGPLAADAAEAAQKAKDVAVIWADADGVVAAPEYEDVILTSVLKGMDIVVEETVEETVDANYTNIPYIGTLANGGVGMAPFHEFDDDVSKEVKTELADLQRQIIIGKLEVPTDADYE